MSAIAIVVPDMPAISRDLAWVAERLGQGMIVPQRYDTAVMHDDAKRAVRAAAAAAGRATTDVIAQWMEMIAFSVSNPPTKGERLARTSFVVESCGDLPMGCWTRETRSQFMLRGPDARFWPTEVEIDTFLRPIGNRLRATAKGIEALAAGTARFALPPPVDRPKGPTDEEVQAVHAKVEEALAGMNAARVVAPKPRRAVVAQGRDLWERRNAVRAQVGMPPLPEPATFEGYGT